MRINIIILLSKKCIGGKYKILPPTFCIVNGYKEQTLKFDAFYKVYR